MVILDPAFVPTVETFHLLHLSSCFVPSPSRCSHATIASQVKDFVRKLQWTHALPARSDPPRFGFLPSTRWPPRSLVPPSIRRISARILHGCRSLLHSASCCLSVGNLTCAEAAELTRLKNCGSIITTADKGGKWTIISPLSYNNEASRQLLDPDFYQRCDVDLTRVTNSKVAQILNYLKSRRFITKREFHYLFPPSDSKERSFRMLPKLHKQLWPSPGMPPGRPIVSDRSSSTRNVGNLIDFFLQPLCEKLPSHLKDSNHLIALLRKASVSPSSILFTFDVASLYTNVPISEGIDCVSRAFLRHPDVKRPDATILHLLRLLLTSNTFTFNERRWLQTHGVAMGKCFAGSFANLFLGDWERLAFSTTELQPSLWTRYQDDIFGVWDHGLSALLLFHEHLNRLHPHISLTLHHGKNVDFLDLSVSIVDRCLQYSLFAKDTDTHFILPRTSHHPPHTFRGILLSELLRFASHSSSRQSFERTLSTHAPVWRSLGYSRIMIREAKKSMLTRAGQLEYWPTGMFPCDVPNCLVCPLANLVNTFNHPFANISYPILHRITCNSSNVIYLIICTSCGCLYVGQTSRPLRTRIQQHLDNIRSGIREAPLYLHFRQSCGLASFSFLGIDAHPKENTRKKKEANWIRLLNTTVPTGLNVTKPEPLSSNLILPFSKCSSRVSSAIKQWCGPRVPFRASYTRARNLRELFLARNL